jgi:fatty acid desaturase
MTVRLADSPAEASPMEDRLLPGSPDLRRLSIAGSGSWLEYRKSLRPSYLRAWLELFLCISLLVAGFVGHLYLTHSYGNAFGFKIGIVFALWYGFWLNAILLFGHEAAHYNMVSGRELNDIFSDWTIWLFFPQSTKSYRRSHWQHHLHLGDHEDTEISYHNCLSPWFLAKTLTGLYLVQLIARYFFRKRLEVSAKTQVPTTSGLDIVSMLRTTVTHAIFIGTALAFHCYSSAVVWLFAVIFLFPMFASVRQILEHRSIPAQCEIDFSKELHGPVNRMFGKDPFSRFFGAAGFNRHILHHWDPTVSYTRFNEMHKFFAQTELRQRLDGAQSTYFATFTALLKTAIRDGR